jgi:dTDP-glucose pyrophosphorylase
VIVIPMAGQSQRFKDSGYAIPKYMLYAHGYSLFRHSLLSFERYFQDESFLFVMREGTNSDSFVEAECRAMGIKNFRNVVLQRPTSGQAETVALGLLEASVPDKTSLVIFNIDTIRQGFSMPDSTELSELDGFLEVFSGVGDNWSFVRPAGPDTTRVVETAEKRAISDLCCTGLYYFARVSDYLEALETPQTPRSVAELKERYVAPLFNALIAKGANVHYRLINRSDVIFCGTPAEYKEFVAGTWFETKRQ